MENLQEKAEASTGKVTIVLGGSRKELPALPAQWTQFAQALKTSFPELAEEKTLVCLVDFAEKTTVVKNEKSYKDLFERVGSGDIILNVALELRREDQPSKRQKRGSKASITLENLKRGELEEIIEEAFTELLPRFTDLVWNKLRQRVHEEPAQQPTLQKELSTEVRKPAKGKEKGRGREVAYYVQKGTHPQGLEEEKDGENFQEEESDDAHPGRPPRKKKVPELTHFLSFPMNTAECMKKLADWQQEVEKAFPDLVKKRYIRFQKAERIHVTLSMLPLAKAEKREQAKAIVERLAPQIKEIVQTSKLSLHFDGFDVFHFDRTKQKQPRVIFITLKEDEQTPTIRKIADLVIREYVEAGILDAGRLTKYDIQYENGQFSPSKLHMTFARIGWRESVNIIEKLESLKDFGSFTPTSFDVSTRFVYEENGFYQPLLRIPLT